jgi:quercetin dioxygenase-like cupin family protein
MEGPIFSWNIKEDRPMKKIVLPNFKELELLSRFVDREEDVSEFTTIESCSLQIFLLSYKPGLVKETHTHKEVRLTFIRTGKTMFTLEDKTIQVGAGDYIAILPNVPHSFKVISEEPLRIAELVVVPTSLEK